MNDPRADVAALAAWLEKSFVPCVAGQGVVRDDGVVSEAGRAVQNAEAQNAGSLNKRLVAVVRFGFEPVRVSTVSGQNVRTPVEQGGQGCLNFTMGMNGMAAHDPMYRAEGWCAEDEVCLHDLLSPVDFFAVLVHELFERWAMRSLGLSYEDAHEQVANLVESSARRVLADPAWARWAENMLPPA